MEPFDADVTVRRQRWANEETGWAVLDASTEDGAGVVLVGALAHLEEGERARALGTWVEDARYGRQVKVTQALPLAPSDERTVLAYLQRLPKVGPRRARRLLELYGAQETIAAIDRDARGTLQKAGLNATAAGEAAAAWEALRATRRLHLLLAP